GYGVYYLLNRYDASYTARGAIQLNPTRAPNPLNPDMGEGIIDPGAIAFEQRTQAEMMRYDTLWTRFLQNGPQVKNTDWYKQFIKKISQADGTVREAFD